MAAGHASVAAEATRLLYPHRHSGAAPPRPSYNMTAKEFYDGDSKNDESHT